ncbi:VanZ family protein [Halopseudomonas sabulinigri]|uniref:VanZ like family protein n=1 Tax=Halopseudomonas sabulinigri TaxID=472181 RepID=A0A1H1L6T0_9GAMM|nr:VanZ family protein [Halopseudomonas sabulinigri]SDR70304.1 VanZ like family protein [Halopseudomonas sabulinigri]
MRPTLLRLWARYRTLFKIAFFALLALGLYLGMRPTPPPTAYSWQAAGYHAGGLFSLTILSALAFPHWRWWWRALFMFAVGVAVEYVQSFHPTRTADWADIYANSGGIAFGLLCLGAYQLLTYSGKSDRPPR